MLGARGAGSLIVLVLMAAFVMVLCEGVGISDMILTPMKADLVKAEAAKKQGEANLVNQQTQAKTSEYIIGQAKTWQARADAEMLLLFGGGSVAVVVIVAIAFALGGVVAVIVYRVVSGKASAKVTIRSRTQDGQPRTINLTLEPPAYWPENKARRKHSIEANKDARVK